MRYLLALVAATSVIAWTTSVRAEEPPESLLGFLKPGMHVTLRKHDETSTYSLSTYTDEEFAIVRDAKTLSEAELFAKYPQLQERLQKAQARPRAKRSDMVLAYRWPAARPLYHVEHVGEDYVLLEWLDEDLYAKDEPPFELTPRRRAIARRAITEIHLQATLPIGQVRRSDISN